jgi:outer membrane protein assembly factor BamA
VARRADVGLATFVDAGKTWAGDVPFGVTSPVKASVGVGLLAAVPVSQRLWRLDLAVPVSADADAKGWEVRLSTTRVRGFWREPQDVARLRAAAAPSTIFTWP